MASLTAREVLDRTDLAELLTSLSGPPAGQGRAARWACFSPDHDDNDPSVTMFVDRKGVERWRCWSEGRSGTAIDAVMIGHNLDVAGALAWLQQRAGQPLTPAHRTAAPPVTRRALSLELRSWVDDCEQRLWTPDGAAALDWLHGRGLDDEVLHANRIGFDPGAHVTPRPAGLPRWRGITICSFDRHGHLAYAQVRNLDAQAPSKYSNPRPEHGALPAVTFPRGAPDSGPLVVAEGVLDGLVVTQVGFRAAALTSTGSAADTHTAARLVEHAAGQPIILALDGDPAGRQATARLRKQLGGHPLHVVRVPDGEDLTSLHTTKDRSCPPRTPTPPAPTHAPKPASSSLA